VVLRQFGPGELEPLVAGYLKGGVLVAGVVGVVVRELGHGCLICDCYDEGGESLWLELEIRQVHLRPLGVPRGVQPLPLDVPIVHGGQGGHY
jgi:hypothetical protein